MRRLLLLLAVSLAACTAGDTAKGMFTLQLNTTDDVRKAQLMEASIRVIERRLERMGESFDGHDVVQSGDAVQLNVTVGSAEGLAALTEELKAPFSFAFMEESDEGSADITVAGHGSFRATGFTVEDLDWTTAETQPNGKARVQLMLTPEGRKKMEDIYRRNPGKFIGMFVRDKLVSKLLVEKDGLKETIIIGNIPSLDFAQTFSDDVNVGRYVTFSVSQ